MSSNIVRKSIIDAFKNVKLGEGLSIRQCIALDNRKDKDDPEFMDIKDYDNWQDITAEQIHCVGTHGVFIFNELDGSKFHLPRAMIYILDTYKGFLEPEGVWDVLHSIVLLLEQKKFRALLNNKQTKAVKEFLCFIESEHEDLVSLEEDINFICTLL